MIKAPNWARNAVPTVRGWEDPDTGELLLSRRHSNSEIREYTGTSSEAPKMLRESPVNENDFILEHMTKTQLEEMGRENGIELDRRQKKTTLIETLRAFL